MKETDQNKHIIFYPSKGLGSIEFSFDEDDIVEALGAANEIDEDTISDSESVVSISYYDLGLDFFVEYFDDESVLSIHSDDVILDGIHLASLSKAEALKFLEEYHKKNGIELEHDKVLEGEDDEESHYFDNIGLTIWYLNDEISDICIQAPEDM